MRHFTMLAQRVEIHASKGTFDVLAYTGKPIRLPNFDLPVVVDLATLKLGKSLIANLDHDASRRVGTIPHDGVENNGRTLRMRGILSAANPARDEVVESHRGGFQWSASIEATVNESYILARGKREQINGRGIAGPVIITASTLMGFAFVSHGADDDTEVRIAAAAAYRDRYPENPGLDTLGDALFRFRF